MCLPSPASFPCEARSSMAGTLCILYATFPDQASAHKTATTLVHEHLAACCNLIPAIQSVYWWEGAVQQTDEAVLIVKTTAVLAETAIGRITALHPYENPAILQLPVCGGAPDFLHWLAKSVLPAIRPS